MTRYNLLFKKFPTKPKIVICVASSPPTCDIKSKKFLTFLWWTFISSDRKKYVPKSMWLCTDSNVTPPSNDSSYISMYYPDVQTGSGDIFKKSYSFLLKIKNLSSRVSTLLWIKLLLLSMYLSKDSWNWDKNFSYPFIGLPP